MKILEPITISISYVIETTIKTEESISFVLIEVCFLIRGKKYSFSKKAQCFFCKR